jgi:hypothetical protein
MPDRTMGRLERSSCRGLDCGQGQSLITGRRSAYGTGPWGKAGMDVAT